MRFEGMVYQTTHFGDLVVTKYISARKVHVRFINTGYETVTEISKIRNGGVKDRLAPSVFGIGVIGDALISINGKTIKEYALWHNVLLRCYDENFHHKTPSYLGCSVSNNFRYFPYFKEWCHQQIGFGLKDDNGKLFQLDKDILIQGNKIYSEDTCVFVPHEINTLFTSRKAKRGLYPIGVSYEKRVKKFQAISVFEGKSKKLGYFDCAEDAFLAYKEAKELHIKQFANKWKEQIDPRVYEALVNYQVEITD